jgi:hypothetical protein
MNYSANKKIVLLSYEKNYLSKKHNFDGKKYISPSLVLFVILIVTCECLFLLLFN